VQIEHVGIMTRNMERLTLFYQTYFGATSGARYVNPSSGLQSRFLTIGSGVRLELMQTPSAEQAHSSEHRVPSGYAHLAISVGPQAEVDQLTNRLQRDGYQVLDGPRWTGDGYYESKVLDPDGNLIEITC